MAFTVNIAHAQSLAEVFQEKGYKFEAVWGNDPDRESKIDRLHSGALQGLCNDAQKKWLIFHFHQADVALANMNSLAFGTAMKLLDRFTAK